MATCLEVITRAYAKTMVRGLGDALDAAEAEAGRQTLQSLYDEFVGMGTLGRLTDVIATEDGEAEEFQRITPGAYTITLPTTIVDASTGEDRPPRDKALVVIVGDESHVYSAPRGSWDRITNLLLTDYAPFSERSFDGLASLLGLRIAEENMKSVPPVMASVAARFRGMLIASPDSQPTTGEAQYF